MEWTFSTELDYKGEKVVIYFFESKEEKETFFQALPFPKGVLSPFTMKLDESAHEYKIIESSIPWAVKEYELLFSANLLNRRGHLGLQGMTNALPN